ncbi:ABC transporter permease [Egbenema bharatensis]|uniref:ABC transporter permease n=1 Tax=Egbenema bharatensis TaxID=3463334 RepID=UPI003A844537
MGKSRSQQLKRSQTENRELTKFIYTPTSPVRHPLQLLKHMGRDLLAARELAWRLLVRDINAQYRQSMMGIIWALIPPIFTAASLVFAKNANILNIGETDLPYPAYVMFSMTLWQTFTEAMNGQIQAVDSARAMVVRINFPREALILAKLGEVFFNFGIKLILIVALFLWFRMPVTWSVFLAPVALIHLVMLGTGIGMLLAPMNALYSDVGRALSIVTSFWLLLTPVIYPPPQSGVFATLVRWNPVTPLLVTTRELATTGVISNPEGFWVASSIALLGLLIAWIVYRLALPFVVERISS